MITSEIRICWAMSHVQKQQCLLNESLTFGPLAWTERQFMEAIAGKNVSQCLLCGRQSTNVLSHCIYRLTGCKIEILRLCVPAGWQYRELVCEISARLAEKAANTRRDVLTLRLPLVTDSAFVWLAETLIVHCGFRMQSDGDGVLLSKELDRGNE